MTSSLRIAIADDDGRVCELIQQMVRKLGNEVVVVAENGNSLIDQCATERPDVVITGDLTPDMRGADAAAVIYKSRPIPIILFSSCCDPVLVRYADENHVFMYLVKPIMQEHLEVALERCRCQRPDGREDGVLVGRYAESSGSAPNGEPAPPSYRQVRQPSRSGQSFN
jgi:DNA-binding NarL/FixJ family response regulator